MAAAGVVEPYYSVALGARWAPAAAGLYLGLPLEQTWRWAGVAEAALLEPATASAWAWEAMTGGIDLGSTWRR
jgi:hypothetical protein